MKKLICILTVAALLLTTSVSSFAAAVPSTTCGNDIASETLDPGSSSGQQFRFDLKALLNELLELFTRLTGQVKEPSQPVTPDTQAAEKPANPEAPAAEATAKAPTTAVIPVANQADMAKPADTSANTDANICPLGNTCQGTNNGSCDQNTCPNTENCSNGNCSSQNNTCNNTVNRAGNSSCPYAGTSGSNAGYSLSDFLNKLAENRIPAKTETGNASKPAAPAPETKTEAPVQTPVKTPEKTETTGNTDNEKTTATSGSVDNLSFEQKVVVLVNEHRAANGLKPLTLHEKLSNVARAKSQDMHDKNYFSHTSPTYGSPFDMMKTFGISYRTAGENIAMGYATPEAVVDGWMNSPGHRANILNASFTQIGVGYVASGNYWTQMFIG